MKVANNVVITFFTLFGLLSFLMLPLPTFGQSRIKGKERIKDVLSVKVTLVSDQISVKAALHELSKDHRIKFSYINNDIPLQNTIHIQADKVPLRNILDTLFAGTDVRYYLIAKQIVLKRNILTPSKNTTRSSSSASKDISPSDAEQPTVLSTETSVDSAFNVVKESTVADSIISPKDTLAKPIPPSPPQAITTATTTSPSFTPNLLKPNNSRITLGLYGLASGAFRNLTPTSANLVVNRNVDEQMTFTFSGGITMDYVVINHFSVRSGVTYLSVGEQGIHTIITEKKSPIVNPPQGQRPQLQQQSLVTYDTTQFSYRNTYSYIGIPLSIGYTMGKKFYVSAYAGIQANVSVYYTTTYPTYGASYKVESHETPNAHAYQPITFSFLGSVDIGYRWDNGISVYISPTYNTFLSSMYTTNDPIQEFPYLIGGAVGVNYRFRGVERN